MAAEDYNVADRKDVLTANEKVSQTIQESPDAESNARALAEGVSHPAYIGYAEALETHQSREDIETLADRRAREYGSDFDAGAFMRGVPGGSSGPRPGSPDGQAPTSEGDNAPGDTV